MVIRRDTRGYIDIQREVTQGRKKKKLVKRYIREGKGNIWTLELISSYLIAS